MDEAEWRESLKLHGEIDVGVYGEVAKLTDMRLERAGGRIRLTLEGPVGELRKLGRLAPGYAAILVHVAGQDAAQAGVLKLLAPPALADDISGAIEALGEGATPEEWLADPTLANLLFALDRYDPEAVGTVTRS
ncbi:MAG: hypothetical protein QOE90_637 [Thermoplasmata archaeon]|jgi:hypothetical protein|nr:hypothetical protein [Thermoplasmata archaeon]